jgi:hypothetical protein
MLSAPRLSVGALAGLGVTPLVSAWGADDAAAPMLQQQHQGAFAAAPLDAHDAHGAPTTPWELTSILWHGEAMRAEHAPLALPPDAALLPGLLLLPPADDAPAAAAARDGTRGSGGGGSGSGGSGGSGSTAAAHVCKAVGCGACLEGVGAYFLRVRLCPTHLRAEALHLPDGAVARFCQKHVWRLAPALAPVLRGPKNAGFDETTRVCAVPRVCVCVCVVGAQVQPHARAERLRRRAPHLRAPAGGVQRAAARQVRRGAQRAHRRRSRPHG